ncbi:MAG: M56 family metallopeptidase [Saprospiraceae bacterium]|nr:M56 family metallopeptidase [Saprospiraceae bacterium]
MDSATYLFYIGQIQEYVVQGIFYSLALGLSSGLILFVIENWARQISKRLLHNIYKIFLFLLLAGPIVMIFIGGLFRFKGNEWTQYVAINESWNQWIFLFWTIGVSIYLIILFVSEVYLQKIIRNANLEFSHEWKELIVSTQNKLNYFKKTLIVHSNAVSSAFVSGIIRPVLVIPTAWMNKISIEDAEFILIHELSHLKVKDHYINILCTIAEVIYFFNPCVHLLVRRIRFQRELCIDELVLQQSNQPKKYALFLVQIGECELLQRAVSFSSIKNQLSLRVKNILGLECNNQEKNKSIKYSVLITLALTLIFQLTHQTQRELKGTLQNLSVNEDCNISPAISKKTSIQKFDQKAIVFKSKKNFIITPENPEKVVGAELKEDEVIVTSIEPAYPEYVELTDLAESKIQNDDSSSIIIVLNHNKQSYYSTGQGLFIPTSRYLFEKDWKYKIQQDKKIYRYIILNEGTKTILSYSGNTQTLQQNSSIN